MRLSYRERYYPSPHLAGAVTGAVGFLLPVVTTLTGATPLPLALVLLLGAAGVCCGAWAAALGLRYHPALLADANGLTLSTPGSPRRREQLTVPWSQIEAIQQGESSTAAGPAPYLEIVRSADAPPVLAAFSRALVAAGSMGRDGDALLAIHGWLPDRARLSDLAETVAPGVRFGETVPATLVRAEEDRELDRSDRYFSQYGAFGRDTLRFVWRYMFGVAAWLLLGVSLLGLWSDLAAQVGQGRAGVWTAGPAVCGKNHGCHVRGEFVADGGGHARGNLALRGDSTLYPAGSQVRALDTGSLDYVYPPGHQGSEWPMSLAIAVVAAVPMGLWIWRVPVRAAWQLSS